MAFIASGTSLAINRDRCSSLNRDEAADDDDGDKTDPGIAVAVDEEEEEDVVRKCETEVITIASLAPARTREGATSSGQ